MFFLGNHMSTLSNQESHLKVCLLTLKFSHMYTTYLDHTPSGLVNGQGTRSHHVALAGLELAT